ncbi:MAG TPA: hypothetical protein PLV42_00050 [bacterium]|nr:hypothetical protein [bacterium]
MKCLTKAAWIVVATAILLLALFFVWPQQYAISEDECLAKRSDGYYILEYHSHAYGWDLNRKYRDLGLHPQQEIYTWGNTPESVLEQHVLMANKFCLKGSFKGKVFSNVDNIEDQHRVAFYVESWETIGPIDRLHLRQKVFYFIRWWLVRTDYKEYEESNDYWGKRGLRIEGP